MKTASLFDQPIGECLKRQGLDQVSSNNRWFLREMRKVAKEISLRQGWVTTDDLREYAYIHRIEPTHGAAWGAVFRAPDWQQVGWVKSKIRSNHARTIRKWSHRDVLEDAY